MGYDTNTQPFFEGPQSFNADLGGGMHEYVYESRLQNMAVGALGKLYSGSNMPDLGSFLPYRTADGRVFRLWELHGTDALAEGNLVSPYESLAVSITAVTASDGKSVAGFSSLVVGAWRGALLHAYTGTGQGQTRRVVHNSATVVYVDRAFATAPAGTVVFDFTHTTKVVISPASAAKQRPVGVSIGTVTAMASSGRHVAGGTTYIAWFQTKGTCEKVLMASALAADACNLIMSTTAGQAIAVGSSATLDDQFIFGRVPGNMGTTDHDVAVPAILNFELHSTGGPGEGRVPASN